MVIQYVSRNVIARFRRAFRWDLRRRFISSERPKMSAWYYVVGILGGYILTSVFLLKCPVIYKKKRLRFKCRHISHRGGAAETLENTIEAYQQAIKNGTEMIELDVHLTKDKEVVVSHDDHLLRTTGQDVHIVDCDYCDLPCLQNDISVTFDHTTTCHHDGESLKIPRLEEVFQQFPGVTVHLDVKVYNEELIDKTNELIKKYNREDITPWGNFSNKVNNRLYKINPNVPLSFSMSRVVSLLLTFYFGLLPFLPIKESCLCVIMPSVARKSFSPTFLTPNRRRFMAIIDFLLMSKVLFKHLTDRGINVYLWVINHEEDFERAFKLGATGVMTDHPTRLQKWLQEHPQYHREPNENTSLHSPHSSQQSTEALQP